MSNEDLINVILAIVGNNPGNWKIEILPSTMIAEYTVCFYHEFDLNDRFQLNGLLAPHNLGIYFDPFYKELAPFYITVHPV